MTTKQLSNLDAWICQHVMGWKKGKRLCHVKAGKVFYRHGSDNLIEYAKGRLTLFQPSTRSDDAMQVLEKCLEKVATSSIEIYQGCDEVPDFKRTYGILREGAKNVSLAETLPLAICLFAKQLFHNEKEQP